MKNKKSATIVIVISIIVSIGLTLAKGNLANLNSVEELGKQLGFITLMPTIVVVVLSFITQNVLFSLLIGFVLGAIILSIASYTNVATIPLSFVQNIYVSMSNVLFDIDNIEVAILCLSIGGVIEIIKALGGFEALASKLTIRIDTPRESGLTASLLGCLIFFDDYANTLIVGPIMKPIVDRVKVSREKLAFIIDSTAAPVAGIALISSWIGVEIAAIENGLSLAGIKADGFSLFINSIPYAFYCIFCISFIFVNSILDRDFGPMLKIEEQARNNEIEYIDDEQSEIVQDKMGKRIFVAISSILVLVLFAIITFYINGKNVAISLGLLQINSKFNLENIMTAISCADTMNIISVAALISSLYTLILGCTMKLFDFKQAITSWLNGVKSLVSTVILLLSAWCLAETINNLGATFYAVEIISANVPAVLVPLLIFVTCCIVSLTSGSFGCMFVVMPLAIPLASKLITMGIDIDGGTYLLLCIGSVIAGSIYGDHCSPVTDCTILSAIGSGCDTIKHCTSQLPYAILNLIITVVCGIILTSLGLNVVLAIILGIAVQILIMLIIGKKPIERNNNV